MWIENINLRNIYNFGDSGTPELTNFKQFNLFIGKNGSGKTNVFRILCDLQVNSTYEEIPKYDEEKGHLVHRCQFIYRLKDYQIYNDTQYIDEYTNGVEESAQRKPSDITIKFDHYHKFETTLFKNKIHVRGDFFTQKCFHIKTDPSIYLFKDGLKIITGMKNPLILLNFCMSYIFDREITFHHNGVGELNTKAEDEKRCCLGFPILDLSRWSSGFFTVSNLLMKILLTADKICLDEPEISIEPRILRRLMDILIWLTNRNHLESCNIDKIDSIWTKWFKDVMLGDNNDVNSYDKSRWDKEKLIRNIKPRQIFIATHSSVLINEFLRQSEICSIYEFNIKFTTYTIPNTVHGKTNEKRDVEYHSRVSEIKKIRKFPHSILDNLGVQGADLLQANGIVWVEGPCDVIYIRKWLKMYSKEKESEDFIQGVHYEFQMFGGTLLDKLYIFQINESRTDEFHEFDKLIDMFSFSRNAYVIVDNDASSEKNGEDISSFKKAKIYIESKINDLKSKGRNLDMWYEKGNTDITTIEDYIPQRIDDEMTGQNKQLLSTGKNGNRNKVENAKRRVSHWAQRDISLKLSDFNGKLENQIESLYKAISSWNQ